MKGKSESEVAQSCPTLSDPMDCSPRGSSVYGIFQARVLEWGAIAPSRDFKSLLVKAIAEITSKGRTSTTTAKIESSRNRITRNNNEQRNQ